MFANAIVTLLLALTCTSLSGWTLGHGGASAQSSGDGLGKAVEVATDFGALELVWSPDQRRIVGVVGERLVSYDVARGRIEWRSVRAGGSLPSPLETACGSSIWIQTYFVS